MIEHAHQSRQPVQRLHGDRGASPPSSPSASPMLEQQRPGGPAEIGGQPPRGTAPPVARGHRPRRAAAACATPTRACTRTSSTACSCRKLLEDPKVVDKLAQAGFRGPQAGLDLLLLPLRPAVRVRGRGGVLPLRGQRLRPAADAARSPPAAVGAGGPATTRRTSSSPTSPRSAASRSSRAFPDALDLLLICVESGMSIEAAIAEGRPGDRRSASIELAEELTLLTAEISLPARTAHGL